MAYGKGGCGPYAGGNIKMTEVKDHARGNPSNHVTKVMNESSDTKMHADGGNGKQTSKSSLPRAYHAEDRS